MSDEPENMQSTSSTPKRGRRAAPPELKNTYSPVHVRLPDQLQDDLTAKAKQLNYSNIQELIRHILREWNKRH